MSEKLWYNYAMLHKTAELLCIYYILNLHVNEFWV